MKEIVLNGKKNGMAVLLGVIAIYILGVLGVLAFCAHPWGGRIVVLVLSIAVLALGWIPLCGLKVLKPQEALVLTLFGKYLGTLKGEDQTQSVRRCRRRQDRDPSRSQRRQPGNRHGGGQQEDLPEDHDPQQCPTED